MAVLSDSDRFDTWSEFMQTNSETYLTLTKADIRAAVNAIDDYLVANASALNSAIPQPARAQLSTAQKALLFTAVVRKRYLTGA